MHCNEFFKTEGEAKAYMKEMDCGEILHYTGDSDSLYYEELAFALEDRYEKVSPSEKPWCWFWED